MHSLNQIKCLNYLFVVTINYVYVVSLLYLNFCNVMRYQCLSNRFFLFVFFTREAYIPVVNPEDSENE